MSNVSEKFTVLAPYAIIFLGGPGFGKGTQGKEVAHRIGATHWSSGDTMGGEQIWPGWGLEDLCKVANEFRNRHQLVPYDIVCQIFDISFVNLLRSPKPFIVDGVPRTGAQARRGLNTVQRTAGPNFPIWLVEFVLPTVKVGDEIITSPDAEAEILRRVLARPNRTDSTEAAHKVRTADFKKETVPGYEILKESGRFGELKKPINALSPKEQITKYIVQKLGVGDRYHLVSAR